MKPVKMNTEELVAMVKDVADLVAYHDSMEGFLSYEASDERGIWLVTASYRYGWREGQGSVKLYGEVSNDAAE